MHVNWFSYFQKYLIYHDDDDDYDYCVGKQRQVNHPPVKQSIMNKHYYTYTNHETNLSKFSTRNFFHKWQYIISSLNNFLYNIYNIVLLTWYGKWECQLLTFVSVKCKKSSAEVDTYYYSPLVKTMTPINALKQNKLAIDDNSLLEWSDWLRQMVVIIQVSSWKQFNINRKLLNG